jgi:hypothetical protein
MEETLKYPIIRKVYLYVYTDRLLEAGIMLFEHLSSVLPSLCRSS